MKLIKPRIISTLDHEYRHNGEIRVLHTKNGKTVSYISTIKRGCFKGFHVHHKRTENYLVLQGKGTIIIYSRSKPLVRQEINVKKGDAISIGPGNKIGIKNTGWRELHILNVPNPHFDPEHPDQTVVWF